MTMSQTDTAPRAEPSTTTHFDVIVVGAGISGVDAAYHLTKWSDQRSFVVLEALEDFGGTWLTHKYPGVRSDSDLYTFGYSFKPWTSAPIASADEILKYMGDVIDENDLARHIRYHHHITSASWSNDTHHWTVHVTNSATGDVTTFTTGFLWMCQGYYRHAEGYTPEWPNMDQYEGRVVHPQTWPDDLSLQNKDVIVIGSGATTATLVPNIADECSHVTIVQRSPTYYWPGPNRNEVADMLRELDVPDEWVHEIVRRKIMFDMEAVTRMSAEEPEFIKEVLIETLRPMLPDDFDLAKHFTPNYRPWRQRIARVPDGDLFAGIKAGKTSVVTDEIDTFTQKGLRTKSGEEITADVIITATGFHLSVLGDITFDIDGEHIDFADTVTYRGMMFTGVPNLVWIFGYFRASWTLRADLVCEFVGRMFDHMKELNATVVTPALRGEDADMPILSWIDPENFNPGYLMRSMDQLPRRGNKDEWQHSQDYWLEKESLPAARLDDGCLVYE
jgi:cation diffusion facilitator CzcD-associated flavoprotein CzcO